MWPKLCQETVSSCLPWPCPAPSGIWPCGGAQGLPTSPRDESSSSFARHCSCPFEGAVSLQRLVSW